MRFLYLLLLILSLFARKGLDYKQIKADFSTVHILEVDPTLYNIQPVRALDNGLGRESVLSLAERHGALASVNGGFFAIGGMFDGRAAGALKIDEWYALPIKPRGCLGWSLGGLCPKMDRLLGSAVAQQEDAIFPLSGLNRPRQAGEAILFTPCFHRTTLTNPDGEELIVVGGVIDSIKAGGSSKIPKEGYVLSIHKTHPLFHTFHVGMKLNFSIIVDPLLKFTTPEDWEAVDYVVGGTPLLIHKGKKLTDLDAERTIPSFLSNKHARTAVGILDNGHWLFVVVDQIDYQDGMTIDELSDLMLKLGCTEALNLDGGGSSTMIFEGALKNFPKGDADESLNGSKMRRVSDAILILPR